MLTLGIFLVCAALLGCAALTLAFRQPAPPRWTTRAAVGELVTIAVVAALAFGLGFLGVGLIRAFDDGALVFDLMAATLILLGAAVIWRRLDVRARLKAIDAAAHTPSRASAQIPEVTRPGRAPDWPADRAA